MQLSSTHPLPSLADPPTHRADFGDGRGPTPPGGPRKGRGQHVAPPPRRRPRRLRRLALVFGMVLAVSGVGSGAFVVWGNTSTGSELQTMTVGAAEDTYVMAEYPWAHNGDDAKLTASNRSSLHTRTYLKFQVPELPAGAEIQSVQLVTDSDRNQPGRVDLHQVLDTAWSERDVVYPRAPVVGSTLTTATVTKARTKQLSWDLTGLVTGAGVFSFAVVNPTDDSVATMYSSEHGTDGPRLVISWQANGDPTAQPTATGTATIGPGPTPTGTPTVKPTQTVAPLPPGGETLPGASIEVRSGESWDQAIARADKTYGPLRAVRVFYPGLPANWPGRAGSVNRTVVVSFKASPRDVIAGKQDSYLRNWFANAPKDRDIYWVYYHEPEDNIENGEFNATDYRAAWRRIAGMADQAGNPRLRATLTLMCWSLSKNSHRNWKDYYAGDDVIDVLGWDCYNSGIHKNKYGEAANIFGPAVEASRSVGKPFGIAETGSLLVKGDSGSGRAAWIRSVADYLTNQGAAWVTYFDVMLRASNDYRLIDGASQSAWRSWCVNYAKY